MDSKQAVWVILFSTVLIVIFIIAIGVKLNKQQKATAKAAQRALADEDFDKKRKVK